MALSYVGAASGTNTATMPAHQVGDHITVFAFRDGSATAPSLPSGQGWGNSVTRAGASCSARIATKIADSTSEAVGTFTNATTVIVLVHRPGSNSAAATGAVTTGTNGTGSTLTYEAVSLQDTSGRSWTVGFAGHRSTNTALNTAPTGFTNRSNPADATDEAAAFDSNGGVSSWTSRTAVPGGTASGWITMSLEIKVTPLALEGAAAGAASTTGAIGAEKPIAGVAAGSSSTMGDIGVPPAWLPSEGDGLPLIHLDFKGGHYWANLSEVAVTDLIGGSGYDPAGLTANGLEILAANANRPEAIGAFLAALGDLFGALGGALRITYTQAAEPADPEEDTYLLYTTGTNAGATPAPVALYIDPFDGLAEFLVSRLGGSSTDSRYVRETGQNRVAISVVADYDPPGVIFGRTDGGGASGNMSEGGDLMAAITASRIGFADFGFGELGVAEIYIEDITVWGEPQDLGAITPLPKTISGVAAGGSSTFGWFEKGPRPAWVPDGALVVSKFADNLFWAYGTIYTAADFLSGGFDPDFLTGDGLVVTDSNGNLPIAAGMLLYGMSQPDHLVVFKATVPQETAPLDEYYYRFLVAYGDEATYFGEITFGDPGSFTAEDPFNESNATVDADFVANAYAGPSGGAQAITAFVGGDYTSGDRTSAGLKATGGHILLSQGDLADAHSGAANAFYARLTITDDTDTETPKALFAGAGDFFGLIEIVYRGRDLVVRVDRGDISETVLATNVTVGTYGLAIVGSTFSFDGAPAEVGDVTPLTSDGYAPSLGTFADTGANPFPGAIERLTYFNPSTWSDDLTAALAANGPTVGSLPPVPFPARLYVGVAGSDDLFYDAEGMPWEAGTHKIAISRSLTAPSYAALDGVGLGLVGQDYGIYWEPPPQISLGWSPYQGASRGITLEEIIVYPWSADDEARTQALTVLSEPFEGSTSGGSSTTGEIGRSAPIAGTSAGVSSTSGALGAAKPIAGVAAGAASTAGAIGRAKPIAGAAAGAGSASGDIRASRPIAGEAIGSSSTTGAISDGESFEGVAAGGSSTTGAIGRRAPLAGAAAGVGSTSGDVGRSAPLAGAALGAATTAGDIRASRPIAGAAAGVGSTTGDLNARRPLSGEAAGASDATLDLRARRPIAGLAEGSSFTLGVVTDGWIFMGAAHGGSSTVGAIGKRSPIAGEAFGAGDLAATFFRRRPIFGAALGAASTAGDIRASRPLQGASLGGSATLGDLRASRPLEGLSAGAGATEGAILARRPIAGEAVGAGELSATFYGRRPIAGEAAGDSSAVGVILADKPFAGAAAGSSSTVGAFLAVRPLAGLAAGAGSGAADIRVRRPFSGVAVGGCTTSGDIRASKPFAGSAAGSSATTGRLGAGRPIAGASSGAGSTAAAIGKRSAFSGVAAGGATTSGSIRARKPVRGYAYGGAATTGQLGARRPIAGESRPTGLEYAVMDLRARRPIAGQALGAGSAVAQIAEPGRRRRGVALMWFRPPRPS